MGFAAHPQAMGKVLGIVYRAISTHLIHKAGISLKDGATGAVTLGQPALGEAVPGPAPFTVTHKMPGTGESTQVVLDSVAVCAGQLHRLGDGNTPVLARKLENPY